MVTEAKISSALAQAIKYFRKKKNYSQIDLSEESGIHRTMIEKLETSKRKPTYHTLYKLCKALGITVEEFVVTVEDYITNDI